jgi:hypothetical protein
LIKKVAPAGNVLAIKLKIDIGFWKNEPIKVQTVDERVKTRSTLKIRKKK